MPDQNTSRRQEGHFDRTSIKPLSSPTFVPQESGAEGDRIYGEETRENAKCVRSPIALGKHRSCPIRFNCTTRTRNSPSSPKSVACLRDNVVRAKPPIALVRHRSCPVRSNGSGFGYASRNSEMSPTRVTGPKEDMTRTNSPIAFGRHRSCPIGYVAKNREWNHMPDLPPLFNVVRDKDERKTGTQGGEALGEDDCKTLTISIDNLDIAYDSTNNTKCHENIDSIKREAGSRTSECITHDNSISTEISTDDNSISTDNSSIFGSLLSDIVEEGCTETEQEYIEKVGVVVRHEPPQLSCDEFNIVHSRGEGGDNELYSNDSQGRLSLDLFVDDIPMPESSGVPFASNATPSDLTSQYDDQRSFIVGKTPSSPSPIPETVETQNRDCHVVREEAASTPQAAVTKQRLSEQQFSLQSDPGDVKSSKSERAEVRIFYDTVPDADDWETLALTDSCHTYNLQHVFQAFTMFFPNKVHYRKGKGGSFEDESLKKLVFL